MGLKRVLDPFFDVPPPSADAVPARQGRMPGGHGHNRNDTRDDNIVHVAVVRQPSVEEAQLLVRVGGVLDLVTAPSLAAGIERAVENATTSRDVSEIVLDLRRVRFLSAAGLRELIGAYQRCRQDGIPLRVIADQRAVTMPLSLTGLDRTLGLRDGVDVPRTSP